jgi:hypothetical protein
LFVFACGATTRTAVSTSLDEFAKPKNFEKLAAPARAIATAVTDGVLDSLTNDERERVIAKLIDVYVDQFSDAVAHALDVKLGPAIQRQVRASVRSVLDEMLDDRTRAGVAEFSTRVTLSVLHAIGNGIRTEIGPGIAIAIGELAPAVRRMLERELGPGLRTVIEDDLAPATAKALDTITPAMAHTVEESSRAAARGVARGIDDVWGPSFDRHAAQLKTALADGRRDLVSTAELVLIAGLGLVVGIVSVMLIWRHLVGRKREDALNLVIEQIKQLEHEEAIRSLVHKIHDNGRARPGGAALAAYLDQHPALKVPRDNGIS